MTPKSHYPALQAAAAIGLGLPTLRGRDLLVQSPRSVSNPRQRSRRGCAQAGVWMAALSRDLQYAIRMLRKSPGSPTVATLTLALGIGANTAIFSFVDGVLLKPLPYPDADRIVRVLEKPPRGERNGISTLNFLDWQKDNAVFDFMAAQSGGSATLTGVGEPVQLRGARVSARLLRHLRHPGRARPHLSAGRRPARQGPGGHPQPCALGEPVRRRPVDPEPHDSPRQRAAHGRRRPAGGKRLRPRLQPALAAARVRAVEHDARLSLADVVRATEAGRLAPAGPGQHERDRGAHRTRTIPTRTRAGASSSSATPTRSSARSCARPSSC